MTTTNPNFILIVDDDDDDRYMMDLSFREIRWSDHIKLLDSADKLFRYLEALSTPAALPALILLDYQMPLMSTEDMLRRLKGHARYSHIPVMVYSTVMTEPLCHRLQALGARSCFQKAENIARAVQQATHLKTAAQQAA